MQSADLNILQQALAALKAGQPAQAGAWLAHLSPAGQGHPDSLYLAALASDGLGRLEAAEQCFVAAIDRAPGNAGYLNSFALFLQRAERLEEAVVMLRRAVAAHPRHAEAWRNLALILMDRQLHDEADAALAQAEALEPDHPQCLATRGSLAHFLGNTAAANRALRRAVALHPHDSDAQLRLARALSQQTAYAEALAAVQAAPGLPDDPALAAQIGDTLVDAGRLDQAIAQYRALLQRWPDYHPVLSALAFLLPQATEVAGLPKAEQRDIALAPFAAALARPAGIALWQAAIAAANGLGDGQRLLDWAARAEADTGLLPAWRVARLTGLRLLGRHEDALTEARAEQSRFPQEGAFANHRAWLALLLRQLDECEQAALVATRQIPREQTAWALLATLWRMRDDPRANWLLDHERLVMTADLALPRGWASLPAFLADLQAVLEARHHMLAAPPEQTLRGGTQTQGELFAATDPVLIAFREALRQTVETALSGLSPQAGHPFLGRLTGRIRFAGSWSVRLAGQGFHVNHVHPSGWLSSAFYVALPPEVGVDGDAGKLVFGVPDAALGLDLPPARIITPVPGRLAIFPSYAWHGTVPFQSRQPRLTAAFDAVPV